MATIEERFQAAVNVIKGLPKNGPYQPSNGMMLKFYGLYKQASEGTVQHSKPGFWDVIGRAKWEAWNDNRHLSQQQAMQRYVENLREIIETMSFTENVQNFVGALDGLDNINLDELEMIAPGMREMAKSHPSSPFTSRTNSPQHGVSANLNGGADESTLLNGHDVAAEFNGDDNGTHTPPLTPMASTAARQQPHMVIPSPMYATAVSSSSDAAASLSMASLSNAGFHTDQSDDEYGDPIDLQHDLTEAMLHNSELLKQVQATVLRMNADLVTVNQRMFSLEKSVQEVRHALQTKSRSSSNGGGGNKALAPAVANARSYPNWWPFANISPGWFVLLVLWPFVVKRAARLLAAPRRK